MSKDPFETKAISVKNEELSSLEERLETFEKIRNMDETEAIPYLKELSFDSPQSTPEIVPQVSNEKVLKKQKTQRLKKRTQRIVKALFLDESEVAPALETPKIIHSFPKDFY